VEPPVELAAFSAALRRRLEPEGLDYQLTGLVGAYNDAVPAQYALPNLGSATHAVIVIGHGKEVWAPFTEALRADPALRASTDPFDRWTSERIDAAVRALVPAGTAYALRFVWQGPPRMVAMQKLAVSTGLVTLGPAGLVIDVVRGPWIAFRAALVVALENKVAPPPPLSPCDSCQAKPCIEALARAQAQPSSTPHAGRDAIGHDVHVQPQWRLWLGVRDACPVGRDARYSDAQIRYHYARDPRALDEET